LKVITTGMEQKTNAVGLIGTWGVGFSSNATKADLANIIDIIGKFSHKSKYVYAFRFRTHLLTKIMEATRDYEYSIFNSYACIPKNIFHNATSLHTSKNVLNDDSRTCHRPIKYWTLSRFILRKEG